MDRLHRLSEIWSWLPAFRAVAETQHLPSAADMLRVGPSALSRAIRLLEQRLGVRLFDRVGRRIVLSPRGREFLTSVRNAMRLLDDGVEIVTAPGLRGEVRIASVGTLLTVYLLPALRTLQQRYPELLPIVDIGVPDHAPEMLLRGDIDVAFQTEPAVGPDLESRYLGRFVMGVYCGPGHPLHGRSGPIDVAEVVAHGFAAPPDDAKGRPVDGWPAGHARRVTLRMDQVRAGCDACADGGHLVVLPDALVQRRDPRLHRLDLDVIPPIELYAVHRTALANRLRADVVVVDEVAAMIPGQENATKKG